MTKSTSSFKMPMFGPSFHIYYPCFLLFSIFLNPIICHCLPQNHVDVPLFIFGDSYFDIGNNNYFNISSRANFYPYGETFFKYPTGRYSDGRIIPDFIAEYADLLFLPPYLQGNPVFNYGANFASGGAGALVETYRELLHPKDLPTQLSYFEDVEKQLKEKLCDGEVTALFSRAIYLISIGTNDYMVPFFPSATLLQTYSEQEYVGMVVGNITHFINEIYKKGGRKFGLINVGPIGCIPFTIWVDPESNGSCVKQANELAQLHNKALPLLLNEMQSQLEGFKYAIHDFHSSMVERMGNPSKYGFVDGKTGCCGSSEYNGNLSCGRAGVYELCENPDDYLFFDAIHLTEKAYKQISALFWRGSPKVTGPYNLFQMYVD